MNIDKVSQIKREKLSGEHYFQSVLEQGYMVHQLSDSELEKIQFDCLTLLAKKTERFNGGDSSSIRVEKAQDILASMLFTIGVSLKTYQSPDDALATLRELGVERVCAEGRKRIDRLVKQAKMRHSALASRLLPIENEFYATTAIGDIRGFFKQYDPEFAAQEIHFTADYPVYNKSERLLGIEFVWQYVEQLYYENLFCTHFSAEDVHHLLCGYNKCYEHLLFNLYEPILATSLGCVLAGVDANRLELTMDMQSFLSRHLTGKESAEIEEILVAALTNLGERLSLSGSMMKYAKQSLPQLAEAIACATKLGRLAQIFIAT